MADVNFVSKEKQTPIILSMKGKDEGELLLLVHNRADLNIEIRDNQYYKGFC